MSYEKNIWIDHIVDPETGAVIQEGTRFTEARANKMEQGIFDAHAEFDKYKFGNRPYTVLYSTIYIDNANGNDNNDGLTVETAIKTTSKLVTLIPIMLNQDFTIKIIGDLPTTLFIHNVLSTTLNSSARKLLIEGYTQNKANHLVSGIRVSGCLVNVEVRHLRFDTNIVVLEGCPNFNVNNITSTVNTGSTAALVTTGSNGIVQNSELNNAGGAAMYISSGIVTSFNNTGACLRSLQALSGGIICKYGTQPSGTDLISYGGSIHGANYGGIVEKGSNANGEYVRFEDGTQICAKYDTQTSGFSPTTYTEQSLTWYNSTVDWVFPATFLNASSVRTSINGFAGSVGGNTYKSSSLQCNPLSGSSARIHISSLVNFTDAWHLSRIAIGRWK